MKSRDDIILAFDFYETLVSSRSVMDTLAAEFGVNNAAEIYTRWKKYQLEYTWRLNSMDRRESFTAVTKQSLIHALKELNIRIQHTSIASCMSCYRHPTPFLEVGPLIAQLRNSNFKPVIFSNADKEMIDLNALNQHFRAPGVFNDIVCLDSIRHFKPHPATYGHLAKRMGKEVSKEGMSKMWLVSTDPVDIVGAINVGMETVWVNRDGGGWKDQLVLGKWGTPSVVVYRLEQVVQAIQNYTAIF